MGTETASDSEGLQAKRGRDFPRMILLSSLGRPPAETRGPTLRCPPAHGWAAGRFSHSVQAPGPCPSRKACFPLEQSKLKLPTKTAAAPALGRLNQKGRDRRGEGGQVF